MRPLRHTVSFCGKLAPQQNSNQQPKQAETKANPGGRSRGFCTLRRGKRETMEHAEESTESGYDGGSLENILAEPQYESIGTVVEKGKDEKRRGSEVKEELTLQSQENGIKHNEKDIRSEQKTKIIPNGHAKFCNGTKEDEVRVIKMDDKKEVMTDGNKVTIHAVIETVHRGHIEHNEIHLEQSDIDEIYEEIPERGESNHKPTVEPHKEEKFETNTNEEKYKETIYSHVKVQKAVKKIESERKEEKQEEKTMVQELVKVAEDEGVPLKTPTPPPRNNQDNGDDTTFVEEEYSYEPELKRSSSKLVLRTRSLLNLEEENTKSDRTYVRPPAVRMKITTGPDGTFVIDGRKASSELNLSDESQNGSPKNKRSSISGEELRKRKEEIFKPKEPPVQNSKKYYDEINQNKTRTTKEEAILNLKKYLKENNIALKELLTNNNVVIIDTYREKKAPQDLADYNHKNARECRITGTTAKGELTQSHTLPRASKLHQPLVQRHYFYRLVKSRPSPPDEELPDPDKVRNTRQMFQKSKEKVPPAAIMLPIAAKVGNPKKEVRPTPEVRLIQSDRSPRRWTDSGSLSSGVSSDMSLLDNMSDKCYSSDEEEELEPSSPVIETHPVSPEVLKKIRACGTTITYYGGRVISHTSGPENPMTMTIMDEIRKGREGGRGKFRLVKSNSCGSRLELAGTEDHHYQELSRGRFYEDVYGGKPLSEEMRKVLNTVEEERREEAKRTGEDRKQINGHDISQWTKSTPKADADSKPSWRELIESRKQKKVMEHNRRPCSDMVFEEFQVLEA